MNGQKAQKNNLSNLIRRQPWIGGPGSRLPFVVESLLGWGLAISCLSVACYHYVKQMVASSSNILALPASSDKTMETTAASSEIDKRKTSRRITSSPILPLTTHSRREILAKTTMERYQQLNQYMQKLDPIKSQNSLLDWPRDELVKHIRSNLVLRRLVSLLMVKQQQDPLTENMDWIVLLNQIWPQLEKLPFENDDRSQYEHDISVIVPAYRENGQQLLQKLQEAHDLISSEESCQIEVVVVHAHCTEMERLEGATKDSQMPQFTKITCTPDVGGGRGPCLNQGAAVAKGRILTFLHADTRLAQGWNLAILQAFSPVEDKPTSTIANSCAFSFAIDTTSITENDYFPPGIRAVERTANLRSHWFHLPYGDQCLSVPSYVFDYVGGYPHQCLMEDYELVRLLRQRVAQSLSPKEELKILDLPAKCHVRRWQKFGVLYVTYCNSKLVNLYSRQHITADDLFAIYYGMDPEGKDDPIPWEVELEEVLKQ